jgi:D-alanyl-D-alanine carboxypeptidase
VLVRQGTAEAFTAVNRFGVYNQHTPFFIGSVSKMFTAVVVLQLCETGQLSLQDSIGRFAVCKKLHPVIPRGITIRQLLQHCSGIGDFNLKEPDPLRYPGQNLFSLPVLDAGYNYSEDHILSHLIDTLLFQPGTQCSYSNTNYYLLAKIIEEVTDLPYAEALRLFLIGPLQLKNTTPYLSRQIPGLAHGHDDFGNDLYGGAFNFLSLNKVAQGDGNICSSLYDLALFFEALLRNKTLLSDTTLHQMLTFRKGDDGNEYGLGILRTLQDGVPYIGHQGNMLFTQTDVFYHPEADVFFAVMTDEHNPELKNSMLSDLIDYTNGKVLRKKHQP